jgi:hypothetical protein
VLKEEDMVVDTEVVDIMAEADITEGIMVVDTMVVIMDGIAERDTIMSDRFTSNQLDIGFRDIG